MTGERNQILIENISVSIIPSKELIFKTTHFNSYEGYEEHKKTRVITRKAIEFQKQMIGLIETGILNFYVDEEDGLDIEYRCDGD